MSPVFEFQLAWIILRVRGETRMVRVVKLKGRWSDFDLAILAEMVLRGDLLTEAADTLDRRPDEIRQKVDELALSVRRDATAALLE